MRKRAHVFRDGEAGRQLMYRSPLLLVILAAIGCAGFISSFKGEQREVLVVLHDITRSGESVTVRVYDDDSMPYATDMAGGIDISFGAEWLTGIGEWDGLDHQRAADDCGVPVFRMMGILPQSSPAEMIRRSEITETCAWLLVQLRTRQATPREIE